MHNGITIGKPYSLKGNADDREHVRLCSHQLMDVIKSLARESEFRVCRLAPVPVRY